MTRNNLLLERSKILLWRLLNTNLLNSYDMCPPSCVGIYETGKEGWRDERYNLY